MLEKYIKESCQKGTCQSQRATHCYLGYPLFERTRGAFCDDALYKLTFTFTSTSVTRLGRQE